MSQRESTVTVVTAVAANLAIAVANGLAALATGSAAMTAEAIHSVVDTANEALLLVGIGRSQKPPDAQHPFGYAPELYFWTFVVAVVISALTTSSKRRKAAAIEMPPSTYKETFGKPLVGCRRAKGLKK